MRYFSVRLLATAALSLAAALQLAHLTFATPISTARANAPIFSHPIGIAFDVNGNAYVLDAGTSQVIKISPAGKVLTTWGNSGSARSRLSKPAGITADAAGHVYVSDGIGSHVQKFSYSGRWQATLGRGVMSKPSGLSVDGSGNLYVADSGNNRILELTSSGHVMASWNGTNGLPTKRTSRAKPLFVGRFSHPEGVIVDYANHIFVSDTGRNRIVKLSAFGQPLAVWGAGGTSQARLSQPTTVAPDASGNLWVFDSGHGHIVEIAARGSILLTIAISGAQAGSPSGMAFDSRGNLYVSDAGHARVDKFSHSGHLLSTWK